MKAEFRDSLFELGSKALEPRDVGRFEISQLQGMAGNLAKRFVVVRLDFAQIRDRFVKVVAEHMETEPLEGSEKESAGDVPLKGIFFGARLVKILFEKSQIHAKLRGTGKELPAS